MVYSKQAVCSGLCSLALDHMKPRVCKGDKGETSTPMESWIGKGDFRDLGQNLMSTDQIAMKLYQ